MSSSIDDLPSNDQTYSNYGPPADLNNCENTDSVVVPILILLIASVGLVANTVVVFIIVVLKEYAKSVTNIYVLQLAIADFIFLFQLPFHAKTMLLGRWIYGSLWCKISESIKMLNYYASINFLTIMSVDRCLAINFGMNQKVAKLRTKRTAFMISCVFWTISVLSTINILTYADVRSCHCKIFFPLDNTNYSRDDYWDDLYSMEESGVPSGSYEEYEYSGEEFDLSFLDDIIGNFTCNYGEPSKLFKDWINCNFALAFIFPLLVITTSYALIIRRILRPMVIGQKSQQSNKTRKRVTIMVTSLVSAFIICWLPYHSFNLARLDGIQISVHACNAMENFTLIFAYSNSAINPFFYTFLGTNFRKRWGTAVGKARKGLRQSILSHSGDYTPGHSMKVRRKSSAASHSESRRNRDDVSVNSFVTKHTIVPTNVAVKDEAV